MALTQAQGASQRRGHPLADGAAFSSSLLADSPDQRNRQLDCKNTFQLGNKQWSTSGLGLLKIPVSLTSREAIFGDEPPQNLWG